MALAKYMCAEVDLWVNTPQKLKEASGKSGMKAALDEVFSLSVLDGWWIEEHQEGMTRWSIGDDWQTASNPASEAASLYDNLKYLVLPTCYNGPDAFVDNMRSAIAMNRSIFHHPAYGLSICKNPYRLTIKEGGYDEDHPSRGSFPVARQCFNNSF